MNPFRSLLVPLDFSADSMAALDWATFLARRFGARLQLLHACRVQVPPAVEAQLAIEESIRDRLRDPAIQKLRDLCDRLGAEGLEAHWEVSLLLPSAAILEACGKHAPDLVVMGTRGNTGLKHVLLGSVAERTVRMADCPVLTVRAEREGRETGYTVPRDRAAESPVSLERILVALDFSTHSDVALELALGLAKTFGSELHVLHALVSPVRLVGLSEVAVPTQVFEEAYQAASGRLEEARERIAREGLATGSHLTEAPAADAITRVAEEIEARLVVMGTRGLGGLKHVLLGSVAERTLRAAPCPVLTVKSGRD